MGSPRGETHEWGLLGACTVDRLLSGSQLLDPGWDMKAIQVLGMMGPAPLGLQGRQGYRAYLRFLRAATTAMVT